MDIPQRFLRAIEVDGDKKRYIRRKDAPSGSIGGILTENKS